MTAHHDRAGDSRLATSGDYEREAQETRRRLADNLDELSDRLTPGQVFDELLTYSRAGGGTMFRAFSNAMRENPVPSLLIGAGCMLFLSERMGRRPESVGNGGGPVGRPDDFATSGGAGGSRVSDLTGRMSGAPGRMAGSAASSARSAAASVGSRIGDATEAASRQTADVAGALADAMRRTAATLADTATSAADTARQTAASVAENASSAAGAARTTAHDLRDQAAGAAEQARRSAQEAAAAMRETAASMGGALAGAGSSVGGAVADGASRTRRQATEAVRHTRESAVSFITEQPLLCAAIGVAVGAALASLLPKTGAEDRQTGEASDASKGTAGDGGAEAPDSAETVAAKVADQAQSAAMEKGLTPAAGAEAARKLGEGIGEGLKAAQSSGEEPATGACPQELASGDPLPH